MRVRVSVLLCCAIAAVVLLVGCPLPHFSTTGSLTFSFSRNINARTLLPPISMEAASYTVSGSGPSGASFLQTVTPGSTTSVDSLVIGQWTITVSAYNADSILIGLGTAIATVHGGESTAVQVTVVALGGDGTLSLTVGWQASQVGTPSILASLTPSTGSALPLSFTVSGAQATFHSATIPAGYYALSLQLRDSGTAVAGAVEAVLIVAGAETTGSYTFDNVNSPGGSLVVNITPNLGDPVPVSISGASAFLAQGTSMTVSAQATDGTAAMVWAWYLNGVSVPGGTGSNLAIGSALSPGNYRMDVMGFTVDGRRAGSASASFSVTAAAGPPSPSDKAITAFWFSSPAAQGAINEAAKTIAVSVPSGTAVAALAAAFTTTGTSVRVGSTVQQSGITAGDFSAPVIYTVTAADGSSVSYTVTVVVASTVAASSKGFVWFALMFSSSYWAQGTIDANARTIVVAVRSDTQLTSVVAGFQVTGVSVRVGPAAQLSGQSVNDFTHPVIYTVVAEDGSTADYTVSTVVSGRKNIDRFAFPRASYATGSIDQIAKTISVTVPYGTDVTSLVADYGTSDYGTPLAPQVTVGSVIQSSMNTPNDFSRPVVYTVTAWDGTTADYTVTVTVAPAQLKTFYLSAEAGAIDQSAHTVTVGVPYGTDLTSLVAYFDAGMATARIGTSVQTSGVTANDFSAPVTYSVGVGVGTTNYVVTVRVRPEGSEKAITSFELAASMWDGYDFYWFAAYAGIIDGSTIYAYSSGEYLLVDASVGFQTTGVAARINSVEYPAVNGWVGVPFLPDLITVIAADGSTASYVVVHSLLSGG